MKNIRSNFVKESLLDYENLAKSLKENTSSAVKDLLNEAVRETYAQLLQEEDENEYEEEKVEDTSSEGTNDANETEDDGDTKETLEDDVDMESELNGEEEAEEPSADDVAETPMDDSEENEWAEFDKYKVDGSDDEYDFSQADDEEIVKVYKLLKDDDQVLVNVNNDNQTVALKDDSTGAEYILDLSSMMGGSEPMEGESVESELENETEDMMESRIFEIALNEYDSHVGYTDNYQNKDVMTNPGTSEPGKNVNDWDAGVPKGDSKPWSGRKPKTDDKPFNGEKGKTVENTEETDEPINELKTVEEHPANVGSTSRTDGPNNPRARKARNFHTAQNGQETSTSDNAYKGRADESKQMVNKVNKILKENNELKDALKQFKTVLEEAAVTNLNLGQIIKLISENSTTKDEKQEIIARFGKEAKTIAESKKLFESINNELKKKNVMNITEDKQFTTNGSKMINETQIYQSKDLLDSLDMMHKICK